MNQSLIDIKKSLTILAIWGMGIFIHAQEVPENLTDKEKIYGLSKVWKEVDKNFVFFDQVPNLDWDEYYQKYIPEVLNTESTYEYFKTLQKLVSQLNDGHTRVVVPWQLRAVQEVRPALRTHLIGNSVFVKEILNDTIKDSGLSIGMEIIEIDGIPVHDYATKYVLPYMFYSTEQDKIVQVYEYHLLRGHIDEQLNLKTANGKTFAVDRKLKSKKEDIKAYIFKVLDNNIGYLKITRFWGENLNESFDSLLPEILKTEGLIIDVSENSGGNTGYANYVIKHLVEKPFKSSNWKTRKYMPAYASWNNPEEWYEQDGEVVEPVEANKRFLKPIAVLISEKTYSAGEDFVSSFLSTDRGKLIGRPTAGTTGNPIGFELHGIGGFQVCTKRDYLPDGKEFVGYGIEPDIFIKKSHDEGYLINEAVSLLKK